MDFILPDLMVRGGWLMYPILLCSVVALAFFVERMFRLRKGLVIPKGFVVEADSLIAENKHDAAVSLSEKHNSAIARIYRAALVNAGQPRSAIKEVVEEVGRREAADLGKYISVLATVASISPLLGLLGTVSGMIKTFNVISYYGVGNPGTLASGISEALLTTAAGLSVAIPTLVAFRIVSGKADGLITELEDRALLLVEALKEREN